ncbi:17064_t:CDS:2 [Racocetra persica]|uniref:17064_t:CDS:1 n=1 Tax=Racocetra persica TaxID=160502 RepID=A0ACA9KIP0_9GLOM|nr:17064_t:CDS:2 [Racocetra persica]
MPKSSEYDFFIKKIVYRFDDRLKYYDIKLRHKLLCENITLVPPPQNLPILKIFLDIYVDDFGTYRNVYHSLGGVYLQFGNMLLDFWKKLKNHYLISFVPFGASFNDFIKPILQEITRLKNGLVIKTLFSNTWVIGGIGCITADLPQENNLADIKWHNTNHEERFAEIESQNSKADMKWLAVVYGNKWNNNKVRNAGLSKNLDVEHPFFQDLHRAYSDYLNSRAELLYRNLEFYNSIAYTVLENNQDLIQLKFYVGDIVELSEETEGTAYAKIESIF